MKKNYLSLLTGLSGLIALTPLTTSCSITFNPQPTPPEPETDVQILQKDVKITKDHWQTLGRTIDVGFELELSKQLKDNEQIVVKDCKFISQTGSTFDEANLLYEYPPLNFFKDDNHLVLLFSLNRKNSSTPIVGDKCVFNIQIGSSENTIDPLWINDLSVTLSNESAAVINSSFEGVYGEAVGTNGSLYIPIASDADLPLKYSSIPMAMENASQLVTKDEWSLDNQNFTNSLSVYPNQTITVVTKNNAQYLQVNFELEYAIVSTDNFVVPGYIGAQRPLLILAMLIESNENDVAEYGFLIINWQSDDVQITINPS